MKLFQLKTSAKCVFAFFFFFNDYASNYFKNIYGIFKTKK